MKPVSIFRVPILWMFLGPPAFRLGEGRSALASLQGDQDIWNYIRLAWWLGWGAVAIVEIARHRGWLTPFLGYLGRLPLWTGLWLVALLVSAAVSPVPFFTLANGVMFVCLAAAALDLGLKLFLGRISIHATLSRLLVFAVALLVLVHVLYLYDPASVGNRSFQGWRIRGEPVAYTPTIALATFFLSFYFLVTTPTRLRVPLMLGLMVYALWWLELAQTRSGYLALFMGFGLFCWHRWQLKYSFPRLAVFAAFGILFLCGVGLLYGVSHRVTWYVDSSYEEYVLRDKYAIEDPELAAQGLMTLNGRTEAAAILLDGIVTRPLGFGYIAGTRSYMSSPDVIDRIPDEAFLGAHNAYLETWAGSGYLGILGLLALIVWLVLNVRRAGVVEGLPLRILLYVLLLEGLFESELAYPFHQSPVLFWTIAACIAAISATDVADTHLQAAAIEAQPRPA